MTAKIVVVGAGTMGRGIAQAAALSGGATVLCDAVPSVLEEARRSIAALVQKAADKGKMPAASPELIARNLTVAAELPEAVAGAGYLIEAIPEDLNLKRKLFAEVARHVAADCVLASNTSSLSITKISDAVERPERVIGMHFFNPVHMMQLVEVVPGAKTSRETVDRTVEFARQLGKQPIVVRDSPGFATSRLGVALGLEAIRMLEAGVASAADIDRAMELGYHHPMGPLRLTDLVGLDVRLAIAEHLEREIGSQFRPPELLRRLVREGHLGRKTGRGFYTYDSP